MKHLEVKLGGFGGQGIILAGYILGKAASIYDKNNATLTQSYGPESRGGACSAQLIISNEEVDFPEVLHPDILALMSKEAYDKFTTAIDRRLRSDTSAIAFISGGLDSRCVVAELCKRNVEVYTFNFSLSREQDQVLSAEFARQIGAIHKEFPRNLDVSLSMEVPAALNKLKNFNIAATKAGLLTKKGQKDEADQLIASSIETATEAEINTYGYQLLQQQNDVDAAIKIFKLNESGNL